VYPFLIRLSLIVCSWFFFVANKHVCISYLFGPDRPQRLTTHKTANIGKQFIHIPTVPSCSRKDVSSTDPSSSSASSGSSQATTTTILTPCVIVDFCITAAAAIVDIAVVADDDDDIDDARLIRDSSNYIIVFVRVVVRSIPTRIDVPILHRRSFCCYPIHHGRRIH
jgi:hypothetical protein